MSTIIMGMSIPNKPTKNVHNFAKKYPKKQLASSQTGWRQPCSLKLTADYPSGQIQSTRRSGNYKPTLWDFDRIQSLTSLYTDEKYATRASELVEQLMKLLCQETNWLVQLEMIDDLQKLGVSYHFDDEINQVLNRIYLEQKYCNNEERDLYSTALAFRLFREHGFRVSQDVFDCFKNDKGEFNCENTKGVLQLYEASFLLMEGETSLEQARVFSTNFLQKKLDDGILDEHLSLLVRRSLEKPLHWSIQRPTAKWFIDAYSKRSDVNPILVELAKLDFNIVQASYQQELKEISRWWKKTELAEKLPFARDRVVENYLWNVGLLFKPQYGYARIMTTKLFILLTVVDDIFDVYATLEETKLFKKAILSWDVGALDQLPTYMQIYYLALDNFINEMAYHVLKEQGVKKIGCVLQCVLQWADLCVAHAKEAEWYHTGYKPTMEEYMENGWVSISAHNILDHIFFLITNPIEKEATQSLSNYHDIIHYSAILLRLADDLGTSPYEMQRGDVPKAVESFMNETGASREEAREHVKKMMMEAWKKLNGERFKESPFSQEFIKSASDLGRMGQYMYQHGDGHGIRNPEMEERISTLIFQPIV